jgi:archaellin
VLTSVSFTLATTTGGDMIDFTPPSTGNVTNKVVISYSDAYQMVASLNWTLTKLNTDTTDNILDNNELFLITVDLSSISANVSDDRKPRAYHKFSLEVKPPVGAVLVLERTIPARVDEIINLY